MSEKGEDVAQPLDRPAPPVSFALRPHHEVGDVKGNKHLADVKYHLADVAIAKDTEDRGGVAVVWMEENSPFLAKDLSLLFKKFRALLGRFL